MDTDKQIDITLQNEMRQKPRQFPTPKNNGFVRRFLRNILWRSLCRSFCRIWKSILEMVSFRIPVVVCLFIPYNFTIKDRICSIRFRIALPEVLKHSSTSAASTKSTHMKRFPSNPWEHPTTRKRGACGGSPNRSSPLPKTAMQSNA